MTLSKHINSASLEAKVFGKVHKTPLNSNERFVSQYDANQLLPKLYIPDKSADSKLVAKYLKEELSLDGIPTLNLATFVNTEIDHTAQELVFDNLVKNLADNDEYPSLIEFQNRNISIISNLWNAPQKHDENLATSIPTTVGTATTGSSEAILLAGLALKKSWQNRRRAAGKSTENPNILMASCAQVALEKFARYFDVENRLIHITEESGHLIDLTKIKENIDENTIGIFVILGSTFTGAFEPVEKISVLLDEVQKEKGLDIKIHVDGASGAFVAPFIYPNLVWDFRIPRVVSINTSGHKFGLTTAGLGWIIWRDIEHLPGELRFKLDYLGGVEETFTLNFSRPGFPVVHQYHNLLSYGRDGYRKIFEACLKNARLLSEFLESSGLFEVLSVIHKPVQNKAETYKGQGKSSINEEYEPGLPVVAFRFSSEFRKNYPEIPQSMLSALLRKKGFIVPNYNLTPAEHDKEILRVVVKKSLSLNLLEKLMQDIVDATELLVKSCDSVRDIIKSKQSEEVNKKLVYDLLLSIASNGVEDLKELQHLHLEQNPGSSGKHKSSYRGTC